MKIKIVKQLSEVHTYKDGERSWNIYHFCKVNAIILESNGSYYHDVYIFLCEDDVYIITPNTQKWTPLSKHFKWCGKSKDKYREKLLSRTLNKTYQLHEWLDWCNVLDEKP